MKIYLMKMIHKMHMTNVLQSSPKKIRKIMDKVESKVRKEPDDVINDNGTIQKLRKELAEDITKGI